MALKENKAFDLLQCLKLMKQKNASDLHLKVGVSPVVRKGKFLGILDTAIEPLKKSHLEEITDALLQPKHKNDLIENKQTDLSYGINGVGRFRFNIFFQRGNLRIVIRYIPHEIPSFESLSVPLHIKKFLDNTHQGLILVTGATGSGKSSTIVSMIDYINSNSSKHIITIEDPIEFIIKDKKSLITQRELGSDYIDYQSALRASLRQDPDIIFFGELRDKVSLETAFNASSTGHLVLSTLHTSNAKESIERILGMLDAENSKQARIQLAESLKAIICQKLLLKKCGSSLIPVFEILINNAHVKSIISDPNKNSEDLDEVLEEGKIGSGGMVSFNQGVIELYEKGLISKAEALRGSSNPEKMNLYFSGLNYDNSTQVNYSLSKEKKNKELESLNKGIENLTLDMDISNKKKKTS